MTDQGSKPVGRPSVMTDEVVAKLEECFANGATDLQACFIAGISKDSLYRYQNENPGFCERKEALKAMTSYQAKKLIKEKILEGGILEAKWHLEKSDPEYNPKSIVNLGGQEDNPIISQITVELVKPKD